MAISGTGGKFATGVVDTGGVPLTWEYLREFSKNFEMTFMLFSGASGKMIHESNLKQKFSLMGQCHEKDICF
jgi:hypothetical protein